MLRHHRQHAHLYRLYHSRPVLLRMNSISRLPPHSPSQSRRKRPPHQKRCQMGPPIPKPPTPQPNLHRLQLTLTHVLERRALSVLLHQSVSPNPLFTKSRRNRSRSCSKAVLRPRRVLMTNDRRRRKNGRQPLVLRSSLLSEVGSRRNGRRRLQTSLYDALSQSESEHVLYIPSQS